MCDITSPPYCHSSGFPRMSSLKEPRGMDEMDIKFQIHSIERAAYCSVLRAFIAQSDLLSWGKEGLITELRKELNVTDIEHGQILVKINSDELVKRIREWQKGAYESLPVKLSAPGHVTDSVSDASLKKRRPARPPLSKSQKYVPHDKPYSATLPSLTPPHLRDSQHCVEVAMFPPVESMKIANQKFQGKLSQKHGGPSQSLLSNGFHISSTGKFKNCSVLIEIRATDKIIHEVKQMAYGTENPDPVKLRKAMLVLEEHERDILQALHKLADVLDEGDGSLDQLHHSYEKHHGSRYRMSVSSDFPGQVGRLHGYINNKFYQNSSREGVGVQAGDESP